MDTTSDEDRKNLKEVAKENGSIIFEVIDPVNDAHIIEYKKPHIVLLDIIANDMNFSVMDYDDLKRVAEKCHLQIKEKVKTFENWSEFYPWYEEVMNENYLHHGFEHVEGFVLRDSNNFMLKMKLPYYKHWKLCRAFRSVAITKTLPSCLLLKIICSMVGCVNKKRKIKSLSAKKVLFSYGMNSMQVSRKVELKQTFYRDFR